jgi:uncharacterized protein involved in exopolysaccharide biosynthesis
LRAAEDDLQDFENHQDISLLNKQEEVLLDQISRARGLVRDAEIVSNEASFKMKNLEAELTKDDPNFGAVGDFPRESFQHNILSQLAELQREREKLRLTELDSGEKIANNRKQFQALSAMLQANLQSTLAERQAILASQQEALSRMEADLRQRHSKTAEWMGLKRKANDQEALYTTYEKKLSETKADRDMEYEALGNVTVIERPIDPIQAIGLTKTTLLGISMLVAVFVALAWVAVTEFFDQKTYTAVQATRYLGAPVLAEVPYWRRG